MHRKPKPKYILGSKDFSVARKPLLRDRFIKIYIDEFYCIAYLASDMSLSKHFFISIMYEHGGNLMIWVAKRGFHLRSDLSLQFID